MRWIIINLISQTRKLRHREIDQFSQNQRSGLESRITEARQSVRLILPGIQHAL